MRWVNLELEMGCAIVPSMLFMVIEDFKDPDPNPIRERFVRDGRDVAGRCYLSRELGGSWKFPLFPGGVSRYFTNLPESMHCRLAISPQRHLGSSRYLEDLRGPSQ